MFLNKKNILITGGTGSFGNKFVEVVLKKYKPNKLVIFSRDEQKQYEMSQYFSEERYPNIRYFIGDVRDNKRLDRACADIDYLIHAAAIKHVTSSEYNPIECIATNINGAQNVIDAVLSNNVKKVISEGFKGTVRMHSRISSPKGVSGLHMGIKSLNKNAYMRWILQDYGRYFVSLTNLNSKTSRAEISYKFDNDTKDFKTLEDILIKNNQTKIFEVPMQKLKFENNQQEGKSFLLKLNYTQVNNFTYMIYGNEDLSLLSIDHLS